MSAWWELGKSVKRLNDAVVSFETNMSNVEKRLDAGDTNQRREREHVDSELKEALAKVMALETSLGVALSRLERSESDSESLREAVASLDQRVVQLRAEFNVAVRDGARRLFEEFLRRTKSGQPLEDDGGVAVPRLPS